MSYARGKIGFLKRDPAYEHVKPFVAAIPVGSDLDREDFQATNLDFEAVEVDVCDLRQCAGNFNLEDNGFQVLTHQSKYTELKNLDDIQGYKNEAQDLLKEVFGAEDVVCFEFRSRKNVSYPDDQASLDLTDPLQHHQPAPDVHADYTFVSGPITVKRHLKEHDLDQYLRPGYRFRLVNLWRSATPQISDLPLAMCDFRSLKAKDVVPGDRVRPDFSGEIFHLHHDPEQKWYFLDNMTSGEPWCFISYDSKAGSHARFCPHSSFHPEGRDHGYRESWELRCVVVTKD